MTWEERTENEICSALFVPLKAVASTGANGLLGSLAVFVDVAHLHVVAQSAGMQVAAGESLGAGDGGIEVAESGGGLGQNIGVLAHGLGDGAGDLFIEIGAAQNALLGADGLDGLGLAVPGVGLDGDVVKAFVAELGEGLVGKLLEQMKAYKEAGELLKYSQCNHEFHKIIYAACPNQPAVEVTLRLKNQMKKYNSKTILIPGRSDHSLQEHTEIYEAIRNRDADRAESCIKKHIHNVRDVFEQYYALLF